MAIRRDADLNRQVISKFQPRDRLARDPISQRLPQARIGEDLRDSFPVGHIDRADAFDHAVDRIVSGGGDGLPARVNRHGPPGPRTVRRPDDLGTLGADARPRRGKHPTIPDPQLGLDRLRRQRRSSPALFGDLDQRLSHALGFDRQFHLAGLIVDPARAANLICPMKRLHKPVATSGLLEKPADVQIRPQRLRLDVGAHALHRVTDGGIHLRIVPRSAPRRQRLPQATT